MGELQIIFIVLVIIVAIGQGVLYFKKDRNNGVFIFNIILALIIAYMGYTSFPSNFSTEKMLSIILGLLGLISLIPYYMKKILISKIILSVSLIGGLFYLFLGI